MAAPDICPFCAKRLTRRRGGEYWVHRNTECLLADFIFADTPENIALWNHRVGKPLWAKGAKP